MANIRDVAAHILRSHGQMSTMKLQKLVYYAKAWHLVWEERVLFPEQFEAWANGPVAPDLYRLHSGDFFANPERIGGNPDALDPGETESVRAVLAHYGPKTPMELSSLTHREDPWRIARGDLPLGTRGSNVITEAAMAQYYESLVG